MKGIKYATSLLMPTRVLLRKVAQLLVSEVGEPDEVGVVLDDGDRDAAEALAEHRDGDVQVAAHSEELDERGAVVGGGSPQNIVDDDQDVRGPLLQLLLALDDGANPLRAEVLHTSSRQKGKRLRDQCRLAEHAHNIHAVALQQKLNEGLDDSGLAVAARGQEHEGEGTGVSAVRQGGG